MTDIFETNLPTPDDAVADDAPVGSLSDYIARRLHGEGREETAVLKTDDPTAPLSPGAGLIPTGKQPHPYEKSQTGIILHHLDSQLTNSHLERYLPTPDTRMRITRNRLLKERDAVQLEVDRLMHFSGPEYAEKIIALEGRIDLLTRKAEAIDQEMARINPFQGLLHSFKDKGPAKPAANRRAIPGWTMFLNPNRALHEAVADANNELSSIEQTLEAQLADPNLSPEQLSSLINSYDSHLSQAEKLMDNLRQRPKGLGAVTHWIRSQLSQSTRS